MKHYLFVAALLFSGAVNAATVTFTFDDPTTETYTTNNDPQWGSYQTTAKDGFVVTSLGLSGSVADREAFGCACGQDFSYVYSFPVVIERSDGGAFALHSFDGVGIEHVEYRLGDGSYGSVWGIPTVDTGLWLNVTGVAFFPVGYPYAPVHVDNIVVSAVPIPAAVWLFGSGLGLLGWLRRRRTVVAH